MYLQFLEYLRVACNHVAVVSAGCVQVVRGASTVGVHGLVTVSALYFVSSYVG